MTEEIKTKGTWGGARAGSGRKKLEGNAITKQVQFRLTERASCDSKEDCQAA